MKIPELLCEGVVPFTSTSKLHALCMWAGDEYGDRTVFSTRVHFSFGTVVRAEFTIQRSEVDCV